MVNGIFNSKIVQPLKSLVETRANMPVLFDGSKVLTAAQLFNNSFTIALNLLSHGFKKNDIAVLAMQPGRQFLELMYALLMLHAKIAIIDPEMGRDNYAAKLNQLKPQWMFVDSRLLFLNDHQFLKRLLFKIKKGIPDISFNTDAKIVAAGPLLPLSYSYIKFKTLQQSVPANLNLQTGPTPFDNLIVYTSGTLAEPKGVLHSDVSLSTTIGLLAKIINAKEGDIVATYLPHFMLLGIASGIAVKIMAVNMKPKPKLKWLQDNKINIIFGPPSEFLPLVIYCETSNTKFPESLTHIMLGSAPVHQSFLKRLILVLSENTKITCTYGMTEHLLVAIADGREKIDYPSKGDYLGKIVSGVEIQIAVDSEILVKSLQMYSRYLHMQDAVVWHATGDLGKIDEQGNLILLGRKKEMIIRRDFNIYPAIYESTVKKIPGVNDAIFLGLYSESIQDEKVYLVIEGTANNSSTIFKQLEKGPYSIDKAALPDTILFMTLPRKGRQKKVSKERIKEYILKNNL